MKKIKIGFWGLILSCFTLFNMQGQDIQNIDYQILLKNLLEHSVPILDIKKAVELQKSQTVYFLDAREKREYAISHIRHAVWVGYKTFKLDHLDSIAKEDKLIVYCSVGYRSEKITKRLQDMGFKDVSNLYGGIFEWVNQGQEIVDDSGHPTTKIHAYDKHWGKWVEKGEKIYW